MPKKSVNLALQGGGAHGAFTWGVLDKFLETDLFNIEAISATSAGTMNAVVLVQGLLDGGSEGARNALHKFWHAISHYGNFFHNPFLDLFFNPFINHPSSFTYFNIMTSLLSPYQFNPNNYHPIREILQDTIDFEKIQNQNLVKLFIGATNIKTGKIKIFEHRELTINAILASACLPKLFQAVEVNNEYYWDGGYLGNPAIFPLIYNTDVLDIIILQTITVSRDTVPHDVDEIESRLREISFNSSLMREIRAIGFVTKLIENGWIKEEYKNKLKKMHMHCLNADQSLKEFALASVYNSDWKFLNQLFHLGRKAADKWLQEHYQSVGKETTINFDDWL